MLLEEARAKISESIVRVHQFEAPNGLTDCDDLSDDDELDPKVFAAFPIKLKRKCHDVDKAGAVSLLFDGTIPKIIPHGRSLIILLLVLENGKERIKLPGIANEKLNDVLQTRFHLTNQIHTVYRICFDQNSDCKAHYLGNISCT